MLEPLVLPNQNLGAIQLLGVARNTSIPFFKQQTDKILGLSIGDKNSVALTQLAASFYTRGLLQHIEPMIQIETGQKGVEMFGIKNLEKVLKQAPKTKKARSEAVEIMNDFLEDLTESVTSLQEAANKILQPEIPLKESLSRDIVNTKGQPKTFAKTLILVSRAYLHLIKVIEKSSLLPETIPWPIVLVPRTSNRLAAISTAFYTPPALFNLSALWSSRPSLRLFTLIYSSKPTTADINQFDGLPRRAPLLSGFGGATPETFKDQTQWERPFVNVKLKKKSIQITVPAKWLNTSEGFKEYLRHSSYMVAFYAYIKVTLMDKTKEYFLVSFDVGISMRKGSSPRFSPSKPVVLLLSPITATHNRAPTEKFTAESKDLQKWIMTQPETQRLFGLTPSSPKKEWKKVAAHVTRIYIGTTSGGHPVRDFNQAAPAAYHEFYKNNFKTPNPEATQHTMGWASLQKAKKLTSLTFSGNGKSARVDMIRDLNVDVISG